MTKIEEEVIEELTLMELLALQIITIANNYFADDEEREQLRISLFCLEFTHPDLITVAYTTNHSRNGSSLMSIEYHYEKESIECFYITELESLSKALFHPAQVVDLFKKMYSLAKKDLED